MPASDPAQGPAVVALGGGHGLAASLSALRQLTANLTAVVTVADNGGSSGRLRDEFGVLPPGDLRMALAALCGDDQWGQTWARVLQHRFTSDGELHGHAVGNLLIVALWELFEQTGDGLVDGLDWVGRLLGARGRVLPMALTPLDITARVRGVDPAAPYAVSSIRGQVEVATTAGEVLSVSLDPEVSQACPAAVTAVDEADYVVLGPGSWYSSVVPHLLVPDLRNALVRTPARLIVTMNLEAQSGETEGYTPEDHVAVLLRQAPDLHIDTVLVDRASAPEHDRLRSAVEAVGAQLMLADVAARPGCAQHDPTKLAHAYALAMKAN
ncbi:MAG: uridine diphosphate-N-acetylglucosamine-binding protein YvcK [Actinomycetota bacterium]|nr:uridine diphosphate-N-acetylglucosamine-binding protein YvcK [Actinomycetota bacterium]